MSRSLNWTLTVPSGARGDNNNNNNETGEEFMGRRTKEKSENVYLFNPGNAHGDDVDTMRWWW